MTRGYCSPGGDGARSDAFYHALRRLLNAPASDVAALGVKIVLAIDHDVGTLAGGAACLKAVRRDAVRLCLGAGAGPRPA